MKSKVFPLVLIILIMSLHPVYAGKSGHILKNKIWTININPENLSIRTKPVNKPDFMASSAQKGFKDVKNLKKTETTLSYQVTDRETYKKIKIDISLIDNQMHILFKPEGPLDLTFPAIDQSENVKALILPHWEGVYAPIDNSRWRRFLADKEWDMLDGLTMPFLGLDLGSYNLTYIVTNRFDNSVRFKDEGTVFKTNITHAFTDKNKLKSYGVIVIFNGENSPIAPAKDFRKYLIDSGKFVSFKEKVNKNPKVARLLGAPHAYLWGVLGMSLDDVHSEKWVALCRKIARQGDESTKTPGKRIRELSDDGTWREINNLKTLKHPYMEIKSVVSKGLSDLLAREDFYDIKYWEGISLPAEFYELEKKRNLTKAEIFRKNAICLFAAYPEMIKKPEEWGYGYSVKMLKAIKQAGIDRMKLTHDIWDFGMVDFLPQVAEKADALGFLLGPYDSYHSIHDPADFGTDSSWPTAQFSNELYENGSVERQDNERVKGFNGIGYRLSPIAARPAVENRVKEIMSNSAFNYYFLDCDAWGEVADDYSLEHPATQEEDAAERIRRMAWVGDTFDVVIGSEGGSSYAAPVIHVAEGMVSNPYGAWLDPDFGNKNSRYFLGRHYPMHGPGVFIKPTILKDKFVYFNYHPSFRVPLNEVVFHDSFVSTNHYSSGTFKFKNVRDISELISLLYLTPPMYHLNIEEFKASEKDIKKFYDFFSPIHKEMGFSQMTDFAYLSEDRMVQKTVFDHNLVMVANFARMDFKYDAVNIPAGHIVAIWPKTGKTTLYNAR